ncbi:MAG TPA: hypothetical protein VNC84_05810 [Gammaproteobacteria bacterium]|jgi:hypothetical protein|nr:hypothetical protein [Gammaproteobacteria bacterium]
MRKLLILLAVLFTPVAWALHTDGAELNLNKVSLSLHAEQWLTTKTATVNITANATVADQGIEKVRGDILSKLQQIVPGAQWHILSFSRQQDQSGLESIQLVAQARLEQADLNGLRNKTKSISKAGETYTIDSIEFNPSQEEMLAASNTLRANIYQQIKSEIEVLNKSYPDQKFFLHRVDFAAAFAMAPMINMAVGTTRKMDLTPPPTPIGNKAELTAAVEIASTT